MTTRTTAAAALATPAAAGTRSDIWTIALAALLGAGLIFVAGFSNAAVMHETAHDTRHAVAFPCH
jgi:cobalt transporter subunit CbtB